MNHGKLIVVEGMDASGKATQTKLLADRLGPGTILYASPDYSTQAGRLFDGAIKGYWGSIPLRAGEQAGFDFTKSDEALILQALQSYNTFQSAGQLVKAMEDGHHVVCDRYYLSGLVYAAVDGLDVSILDKVSAFLPQPDLAVFVDVSLEESLIRRPDRRDRYERDHELLREVRYGYHRLFEERMEVGLPYVIVDGERSVEQVHGEIWEHVKREALV